MGGLIVFETLNQQARSLMCGIIISINWIMYIDLYMLCVDGRYDKASTSIYAVASC